MGKFELQQSGSSAPLPFLGVPSRRSQRRKKSASRARLPLVHVKVAHAGSDLHGVGALIKPGLLYGDLVMERVRV